MTSNGNTTVLVDLEVDNGTGTKVFRTWWDNQPFKKNGSRDFPATWRVAASEPAGTHTVKVGIFTTDWKSMLDWNNNAAAIAVTSATPSPTPSPTPTPTATPTPSPSPTPTPAPASKSTPTPSSRVTPTPAPSPSTTPSATPSPTASPGPAAISGLHVQDNQVLTSAGQAIRLRGINRSGTQ